MIAAFNSILAILGVSWFFLEGLIMNLFARKHDEPFVNFDLERMRSAIDGPRITMPDDLKKEDFCAWMAEQAKIIRERRP